MPSLIGKQEHVARAMLKRDAKPAEDDITGLIEWHERAMKAAGDRRDGPTFRAHRRAIEGLRLTLERCELEMAVHNLHKQKQAAGHAKVVDRRVAEERERMQRAAASLVPTAAEKTPTGPVLWRIDAVIVEPLYHEEGSPVMGEDGPMMGEDGSPLLHGPADRRWAPFIDEETGEQAWAPCTRRLIVLSCGVASCPDDRRHRETIKVSRRRAPAVAERLKALIGVDAAVDAVTRAMAKP